MEKVWNFDEAVRNYESPVKDEEAVRNYESPVKDEEGGIHSLVNSSHSLCHS